MSFRFRNFQVYQNALEAYKFIVTITRGIPREHEHLRDQIRRAALSVALNIAEGSGKSSDRDFKRYLGNAIGSTNEVAAALEIALATGIITQEQFVHGDNLYRNLTNQIGGFMKTLSTS